MANVLKKTMWLNVFLVTVILAAANQGVSAIFGFFSTDLNIIQSVLNFIPIPGLNYVWGLFVGASGLILAWKRWISE